MLDDAQLQEGASARAVAGDATVLLYRSNGHVHAIGSRCSHAGGTLDDGGVVHGPASVPQASYETRVEGGQVEIRLRR